MNPFLLQPNERLSHWKEFRKSLSEHSEKRQLELVAAYWAQTPMLKIAYDPNDSSEWRTAWEMIYSGNWCRSSIAIGMECTLRLAGWSPSRLVLRDIIDSDISEQIMILRIDEAYALNYDWGSVIPYPRNRHRILREWQYNGRSYTEPKPH